MPRKQTKLEKAAATPKRAPKPWEFKPGNPGKPKGAKHGPEATLRKRIEDVANGEPLPLIMARIGLHEIAKGADGDLSLALTALDKACPYIYPKLKSIEHSGKIETMPQINIVMPENAAALIGAVESDDDDED